MNLHERYKQITKSVQMNDIEKNAMRSSLVWHVRSNSKPIKTHFYKLIWFKTSVAFAFILIVTSSGVAFASRDALPGDFTYPLKIQIEEIKGITKTTPKQKLVYNKKRAETRLTEMKVMLASQNTSAEQIAIASKELENHIEQAKNNAAEVATSSNEADQKEALIAVKDLEQNIASDVKVLTALADEKNIDQKALSGIVAQNKDSVTKAVQEIALPKKAETDALKNAISNIETNIDIDIPAGTGEDRSVNTNSSEKPILQAE